MKNKLEAVILRIWSAIRGNPVEMLLAALVCCLNCYRYGKGDVYAYDMLLYYFPALFLISYTLNQCFPGGRLRSIYYLSVLASAVFLMIPDRWTWSATYTVTLVVVQLIYLASRWRQDNKEFMTDALHYLRSLLSATFLAGISWLLALSIYACITYIFEIGKMDDKIFIYIPSVAFMGILPLLFLMFNRENEGEEGWLNRMFDVLLNYVLSPALLIYSVILYLYFIKIAVLWSLPKGAVAYIVVSFISAIFLLKGCQVFLSRRYYDWFYDHASIAAMPTLVIYWIGVVYRLREYGFTEARVYLVVVGVILSVAVLIFLSKKWGRYLYVACLAGGLLSVVTYIPGISARDIERISQQGRGNQGKEIPVDYVLIDNADVVWDTPIDIRGYSSLEPISNYRGTESRIGIELSEDTLSIHAADGSLLYQKPADVFLDEQLSKVGLTQRDSIPVSAYPELLQIDLDSGKIVLGGMNLRRDSLYHLYYINAQYYLRK